MNLFDPECVANLNWLIEQSGAKLVLSSSWRIMHSLEEFNEHAIKNGIPALIDRTEQLVEKDPTGFFISKQRGEEIAEWLSRHPHVTDFVVIDDSTDMKGVERHWVQTSMEHGLTKELAEWALKVLEHRS